MALAQGYPPSRHIHRDLRLAFECDETGARGWLPVTPEVLSPAGWVRAGVLAIVADVTAGVLTARASRPDPAATADLSLHLLGPVTVEAGAEIEVRGRVTRRGRTTVVSELDIVDPDGSRLGVASTTFAVLPGRERAIPPMEDAPLPRTSLALAASGLRRPVLDECGIAVIDAAAGHLDVPVTDFVLNSLGSLQGGVVATVIDVAAAHAIGVACGARVETVDLQVNYLQPARSASVQTTAEVFRTAPSGGAARVEVLDGETGALTAVGRVTGILTEGRS